MSQLHQSRKSRVGSVLAPLPNFVPNAAPRALSQTPRISHTSGKSNSQVRDDSMLKSSLLEQSLAGNQIAMKYLHLADVKVAQPPPIPSESEAFQRKLEKTKFYLDLKSRPQPAPPKPPTPPEPGPVVRYTEHMDIFAIREKELHFVKVLRETAEHLSVAIKQTEDVEERSQKVAKLDKTYDQEAVEYQEIREKIKAELGLLTNETESLNALEKYLDQCRMKLETQLASQVEALKHKAANLELYQRAKDLVFELCTMTPHKEQGEAQLAYEDGFKRALVEYGRVASVVPAFNFSGSFEEASGSTGSFSRDAGLTKRSSFTASRLFKNTPKVSALASTLFRNASKRGTPMDQLREATRSNMNLVRMEAKVQLKQNATVRQHLGVVDVAPAGITSGFELLTDITTYLDTHTGPLHDDKFLLRHKQILKDAVRYVCINQVHQCKTNIPLDLEELDDHIDDTLEEIKSLQYRDIMSAHGLLLHSPALTSVFQQDEPPANPEEEAQRFHVRNILTRVKFHGGLQSVHYEPFKELDRLAVSQKTPGHEILRHYAEYFQQPWNQRNRYQYSFEKIAFFLEQQEPRLAFIDAPYSPTYNSPTPVINESVSTAIKALLQTSPRANYPFLNAKELADELYDASQKVEVLKASAETFQDLLDEHKIQAASLQQAIPQKKDLSENIKDLEAQLLEIKTRVLEAPGIFERLQGSSTEQIDARRTLAKKLHQYRCIDGIELILRREEALQSCPHKIEDFQNAADIRIQNVKDGIQILRQALESTLVHIGLISKQQAEKLNVESLLRYLEEQIYEAERKLAKHPLKIITEQKDHLEQKRRAEARNRKLQQITNPAPQQTEADRLALLAQYEAEDAEAMHRIAGRASLLNSKCNAPKVLTGKQVALQKEIDKMQDFSQPTERQNFYQ